LFLASFADHLIQCRHLSAYKITDLNGEWHNRMKASSLAGTILR